MSDQDELQAPTQHETYSQRSLLELTYAVKSLAEIIDVMHRDLRRLAEDNHGTIDQGLDEVRDIVSKNAQLLQITPISTSDRLERLIDKKVDGVLEDVRISVNDIRQKLWYYQREKEAQSAVPAVVAAVPSEEVSSFEIKKDEVRVRLRTANIEKAWKVIRWVIAGIIAGGGGWAIVKNIILGGGP